jgi:hypothetical protein
MDRFTLRGFLFLVALSAPFSAFADSQAGGVPSLADRVTILESSVTTLQTALTNLQTTVTNLNTTLVKIQSDNTALQSALNAETANRVAGDAALRKDLNAEISDRFTMGFLIESNVVTETNDRKSADADLNNLIQNLKTSGLGAKVFATTVGHSDVPNGNLTTVAVLGSTAAPLPAGRYLLVAKGNVYNPDHNAFWGCYLHQVGGPILPLINTIDSVVVATESDGINASNAAEAFALTGVVTLTQPGQIEMACESGEASSTVDNMQIIALQVI